MMMSDADAIIRRRKNESAKFGESKSEKVSFNRGEMVKLNSEEILVSAIVDGTMETEVESDEDGGSSEEDRRRLMPSRTVHQCVTSDRVKSAGRNDETRDVEDETVWSISIQMFIPFLLAGFGMVVASLLLDIVQHWPVYRDVSEVYILVPALLGLKGNLEMTLASRLSTHANLGHMDTPKQQWMLVVGNLSLIQCQAMVVGLLASLAAVVLGWIPDARFDIHHALLLCASALATASVASFLLGLVTVTVILLSKRMKINPDNVATPIAASLGDLITLALLSGIASLLYKAIDSVPWIAPTCIVFHIIATPVWGYIAARNPFTKEILDYGWTPVICSMLISSVGGLTLDYTISSYKGIAVFQLIINGIGGNLVAVQASRISTSLHKTPRSGVQERAAVHFNPFHVYFSKGGHARTARVLLAMVIPGHLIFAYTISYLQAGHTSFTATFIVVYLIAALLQVILLLYIAQLLVVWLWKRGIDPDSSAIPYLTAIGDLIGTALLGIAFHILYAIGDGDSDVGD
nr:solute carrier family 41 member 1-like isoform X1 [Megalopta genalis]XP_033341792.1 solute carrier family 41 member 1-like isoform X1 [Megalopta genalis]